MLSLATILRLLLASLASGLTAGLSVALCFYLLSRLSALLAHDAGDLPLPLLSWLVMGSTVGLTLLAMLAFFAGSAMWALAAYKPGARRPAAWAAAGAAAGGGLIGLVELTFFTSVRHLDAQDVQAFAACLLCGAAAALAFLGTMRAGGGPGPAAPERP